MIQWPWKWEIQDKWKWLGLSFIVKCAIFTYFAFEFKHNWPEKDIQSSIVVFYQDSYTYYTPVEEFVDGNGYKGACRMPGFLPIYGPLYALFGSEIGRVLMIICQVLLDALATYLIALFAYRIVQKKKVFQITFFLSVISTFVSVWNNYAVSDSLAVSTLVFSVYYLQRYSKEKVGRTLFLSGLFLCWSIFFRPIHLLIIPLISLSFLMVHWPFWRNWRKLSLHALVFLSVFIVSFGIWITRNFTRFHKFIPLQEEPSVCYYNLQDYHLALRDNILAWGCDFQEWSVNTEFAWFLDSNQTSACPVPTRVLSSAYTLDSLFSLKASYHLALKAERNRSDNFDELRHDVIRKSIAYKNAYVREHPLDYYLINRIRLLKLFLFPGRLDNLPLPARNEMNLLQFGFKSFYLVLLSVIIAFGLIGNVLISKLKLELNVLILWYPIFHILILGAFLGYAEQRYLTPAYPFLTVGTAIFLSILFHKIRNTKAKPYFNNDVI